MFKFIITKLKKLASRLYPVYGIDEDEEVQNFLEKSNISKEELKAEINKTLWRAEEIIDDAQSAPKVTIISNKKTQVIEGEDLYFFVLGVLLQQNKNLDDSIVEAKSILNSIRGTIIDEDLNQIEIPKSIWNLASYLYNLISKNPMAKTITKGMAAVMSLPDYISSRLIGYATGNDTLANKAWLISASAGALWQWGLWGAGAITGNPALFALGAVPIVGATGITAGSAAALLRLIYERKRK